MGEPRRWLGWGGIRTCQTGQAGKGRVSQETWVVGNGVWGGVLKSQTGAGWQRVGGPRGLGGGWWVAGELGCW